MGTRIFRDFEVPRETWDTKISGGSESPRETRDIRTSRGSEISRGKCQNLLRFRNIKTKNMNS